MNLQSVQEGQTLAPFRLAPSFVARVWGSMSLSPWYQADTSGGPIGEVWLSGDDCKVLDGPLAGMSFKETIAAKPEAMLGDADRGVDSPLLLKLIFAREKLSVQVHPDDKMAQKYGQRRGKTECWYALAAEQDAQVAVGLKAGVTLAEVREGIHNGTL